jgi:hypothetical protein
MLVAIATSLGLDRNNPGLLTRRRILGASGALTEHRRSATLGAPEGKAMQRVVVLCSLVSAAVSALVTALAFVLILPSVVEAQAEAMLAQRFAVVRADGSEAVRLQTEPTSGGQIQLLDGRGNVRAGLVTALSTGSRGEFGVALNMYHETPGVAIPIRLGNQGGGGTQPLPQGLIGYGLRLNDPQGNARMLLLVDDAGEPSIYVLGASGNIVWRAPGPATLSAPVQLP